MKRDGTRDFHEARWDEPILMELGEPGQRALLFPHLTALENVAFGLRSQGVPRGRARAEAARWLEAVGLAELVGVRRARLSGGQAARVALARALASRPQVLVLDEPSASLDVRAAAHVRHLLAGQERRARWALLQADREWERGLSFGGPGE